MRFMVIVKANAESESGKLPGPELLEEMGRFNQEMIKAGVMLAGEGLAASAQGARIRYDGKQRTVVDGPFTEAKELVGGFWIIQTRSREEALEWMKRAPFQGGEVEIRRVLEEADFAAS
ncbi:MAG TPA: YciI family protein [Candidatus Elarobacter sp.]|jgi:hypothetical protein|nr:YciI family protein [Candidatus Elarobacter sp.]